MTGGTQRKTSEVKSKKSVASQKLGTDSPISPSTRATKSMRLFWRTAERMPRGMAIGIDIRIANSANSSVMGKARISWSVIGSRLRNEVPKFRCRISPIQRVYCTGQGSVRPKAARISSFASSVIVESIPTIASTISPGNSRIITKMSIDIPIKVGIRMRVRRRIYLNITKPVWMSWMHHEVAGMTLRRGRATCASPPGICAQTSQKRDAHEVHAPLRIQRVLRTQPSCA